MNLKEIFDKVKEKNNKIKEEEIKKINFFKKIKYSVCNPKKYDEMVAEGVKSAFNYLLILIFILSAIICVFYAKKLEKQYQDAIINFEKVLPVAEYKEGILTTQAAEKVEISNFITKTYIGGNVIIDTTGATDEEINQYVTSFNTSIGYIMLTDKVITVNLGDNIREEYRYPEFFEKYINSEIKEFTNTSFVEHMKSVKISFSAQYLSVTISYSLAWIGTFLIYIIIFTLVYKLLTKIMKRKIKFGELFAACCYSFTASIFIQLTIMILDLINVEVSENIPLDNIMIAVGVIYSLIYINIKPKKALKEEIEVITNKK